AEICGERICFSRSLNPFFLRIRGSTHPCIWIHHFSAPIFLPYSLFSFCPLLAERGGTEKGIWQKNVGAEIYFLKRNTNTRIRPPHFPSFQCSFFCPHIFLPNPFLLFLAFCKDLKNTQSAL